MNVNIAAYNGMIRRISFQHSSSFGIDTPRSRKEQAKMSRRIRQDYPFRDYGLTWK